jgi:catechol 2,3-dioxygenase-like lactoylglutathione lyase family enzyme
MAVSRVVPDLKSKSLEEAKAFYTDVLGLQKLRHPPVPICEHLAA